jgi:nuclear mRNA export protein PCID2/THP1
LKFCGADVDVDEVECIVANLIFRKFIKGYISHKNRVVVLSKIDPFPSLKTVFANGA